ncbi:4-hydroxythreonine-4-phosphate dehydrogenase PdxA [Candidatus Pelagibacter sp.]|uniref:4-hydroxythreonine-4-phosphate dehydrogenase PdxA n=1 Tax=Candidatus Pelagibacter sp. TaxID=2024849 RepID=UPI003F857D04
MLRDFKPIIVVAGEPNSIFLELYFKVFKKKIKNPLILIVSEKILFKQSLFLKQKIKVQKIDLHKIDFKKINNKQINFIDVEYNQANTFQKISTKSKQYIEKCFEIGLKILKNHKCAGLVNGPISKKHFLNFKYKGITEYLAKKNNINMEEVAMLIFNNNLSVSPITTHLPISKVSQNIKKRKIISNAKLIDKFFRTYLKITPKIAVTGLNPHCETNNVINEEKHIINPSIRYLQKNKIKIFGPFAADTIFMKNNINNFDVVIGMYHDQVLAPIKAIYNFKAINITLGLPFIRVSPDHGPNEKMMGKNKSNYESLYHSIKFFENNVFKS